MDGITFLIMATVAAVALLSGYWAGQRDGRRRISGEVLKRLGDPELLAQAYHEAQVRAAEARRWPKDIPWARLSQRQRDVYVDAARDVLGIEPTDA